MSKAMVVGAIGALAWIVSFVPASRADDKSILEVRVPRYADVWVLGEKTHQLGTEREFITPELSSDHFSRYNIRARWIDGEGRTHDQLREVPVRGGDRVVIDFFEPAPTWQRVLPLPPHRAAVPRTPAIQESRPPTYTSFYREMPPQKAEMQLPENAALIRVKVPANAQVWLGNEKTHQGGDLRQFATPALDPSKQYSAVVKAKWMDKEGLEVEQQRKVELHPGDHITVDFTRPARQVESGPPQSP